MAVTRRELDRCITVTPVDWITGDHKSFSIHEKAVYKGQIRVSCACGRDELACYDCFGIARVVDEKLAVSGADPSYML
jgi:hypothetical protein